jgi:predicted aminopeptidase
MSPLKRVEQRAIGIGIFLLVVLSGCSTAAYVTRLGFGQAKVLLFSRSNEDVFKDPSVSQGTKDRIRFVLEVKRYAEERIGLKKTGNYSRYFKVDSQGLFYVISACPRDSLNPYQWDFPVVGRMSYKGFFSLKEAQKEREKLERAGYDTYLRRAWAYSTLGWFKDPIFSSMLDQTRAIIAQIVIHELTHTTLFIEDHLDFNEQMATFIGDQGAIEFFSERYGRDSPDYWNAHNILDDELIFGKFIEDICGVLRELYSSGLSKEKKLELREGIFRKAKEDFRGLKVKLKTRLYFGFEDEGLNNAVLLSYWQYIGELDLFKGLYHMLDEDLGKMIAFLKEVERSGGDPRELVQRRLLDKTIDIQQLWDPQKPSFPEEGKENANPPSPFKRATMM